MNREMQRTIRERKQEATDLIKYALPQNGRNMASCPTKERVTEILSKNIPYCGEKPVITNINVIEFHKNDIIRSAYFKVETSNGKVFKISAYQNLKGRTPEQKEADKTETFPSGLFTIFHDEITPRA
jgi:hypothetical protein